MSAWWESFFDEAYVRLWGESFPPERNAAEAAAVWKLLGLVPGARILDAPCGYGRLSHELSRLGASVLGVDQSETLLGVAERGRGGADVRYLRQDLRQPLAEGGFDVALNMFSSLGYGSDEDDLAILRTLAGALVPGGQLLVETMHRDLMVARLARGAALGERKGDGTLILEVPTFDAVAGRMKTSWYWSGPHGSGEKHASIRVYTATELVKMIEAAGLRVERVCSGLGGEPFRGEGPQMGGRLALVARNA